MVLNRSFISSFVPNYYHHHHEPHSEFLPGFSSSRSSHLCPRSQSLFSFLIPKILHRCTPSKIVKCCSLRDRWPRTRRRLRLLRVFFLGHCCNHREVGCPVWQVCSQIHPDQSGLSKGDNIAVSSPCPDISRDAVRYTTGSHRRLTTLAIMMVRLAMYSTPHCLTFSIVRWLLWSRSPPSRMAQCWYL